MDREKSLVRRGLVLATAFLVVGLPLSNRPVMAQRQLGPDGEPLGVDRNTRHSGSKFLLFAERDFARSLVNPGQDVEMCWENLPNDFLCPYGFYQRSSDGTFTLAFREGNWMWGVPRSEWLKHRQTVPSLANALGRGYSIMSNYAADGGGGLVPAILPKDGTRGVLHSGVESQNDGTCRQTRNWTTGDVLLPSNDCPETWGTAGWVGQQLVSKDQYLDSLATQGGSFAFSFWRMDNAFGGGTLDPGRTLGDLQAYGVSSDFSEDKIPALGSVLPGGAGDPQAPGWPLGIDVRADAFAYNLPSLKNTMFVQTILINNSLDVYGTPLDYDSFYVGFAVTSWFNSAFQNSSVYNEPETGMWKSTISGQNPACNGKGPTTDIPCRDVGDIHGAAGMVVLKSPIGDLRYKMFSDPSSDFFFPGHPLAGDTITYNHAHMCGFRRCTQTVWNRAGDPDGQQRIFGHVASIGELTVGDRNVEDVTSIDDEVYWHTFRPEVFQHTLNTGVRRYPAGHPLEGQLAFYNKHVPPGWNNTFDLDTLYLDSCGTGGCVESWSDSLPNFPAIPPGYINAYNNVGQTSVAGPFRFAAGDTIGWIQAFTVSVDDLNEVDAALEEAVKIYLNFFQGPTAPPVATLKTTTVRPGSTDNNQVTLFLTDEPLEWVDGFLQDQALAIEADPNLVALNPDLPAAIRARAVDNVAAVHIFKSCDGGGSFTDDSDCDGDPVSAGRFADVGWLPYETFEIASTDRSLPVSFVDQEVQSGRNYLYVLVSESRGAEFLIVQDNGAGGFVAEPLSLAPRLFSALSTAVTDPNVTSVYVPATLQAGATSATGVITAQAGPALAPPDGFAEVSVSLGSDAPPAGDYQILFGDGATVVDRQTVSDGELVNRQATVTLGGTDYQTTSLDGVTLSGGTLDDETVANGVTTRTYSFAGLTALLVNTAGNVPLLVTETLTGSAATPAAFVRRDDWPQFVVEINDDPGAFVGAFYEENGERIHPTISPSLNWASAVALASPDATFGEYRVQWADDPFGPAAPFRVNFLDPAASAAEFAASVAARNNVQNTLGASTELLDAVREALDRRGESARAAALTEADFVVTGLPFTVRNASFDRAVEAVFLRRTAANPALADTRVLGSGGDTLRIAAPEGVWLPGDDLILLENIDGQLTVTWDRVRLACPSPVTCNPVTGRGRSVYIAPGSSDELVAQYLIALTSASRFDFTVSPGLSGLEVAEADIVAGLDAIQVVPNPYLMFSQIDRGGDPTIMFTHLPPSGIIRIFTVSGQFVQQLVWQPGDLAISGLGAQTSAQGDLRYNLRTREGTQLASGLYIYVVSALDETGERIGKKVGKFVIVR